jgi:hypothetical protein
LILYITFSYNEIFDEINKYRIAGSDYEYILKLQDKDISKFVSLSPSALDVRGLLLKMSMNIFETIRFVSFVFSILLLVLVYFLTLKITNNTIAGLLSFFLLIQN